jgi:hypothetical protein
MLWTSGAGTLPMERVVVTKASQSLSSNVDAAISFTDASDVTGLWSIAAPTRITIQVTGWYLFSGYIRWNDSTYIYGIRLRKNGTTDLVRQAYPGDAATSGTYRGGPIGAPCYLIAGDYVEMIARPAEAVTASVARLAVCGLSGVGHGATVSLSTSLTQSTDTTVWASFDTEERDDGGLFTSGSPDRLTIPAGGDGWYFVSATAEWPVGNPTGPRLIGIERNTTTLRLVSHGIGQAGDGRNVGVANCAQAAVYLSVGDYLRVWQYHNAGSSIGTNAGTLRLSVVRVSDSSGLGAVVTRVTNQTSSAGVQLIVSYTGAETDIGGFFGSGSKLTVPSGQDGWYFAASWIWATGSSISYQPVFRKNDDNDAQLCEAVHNPTTGYVTPETAIATAGYFAAGDYIETAFTPSGGTGGIQAARACLVRLP